MAVLERHVECSCTQVRGQVDCMDACLQAPQMLSLGAEMKQDGCMERGLDVKKTGVGVHTITWRKTRTVAVGPLMEHQSGVYRIEVTPHIGCRGLNDVPESLMHGANEPRANLDA